MMNQKGFSLIELLLVVTILGILLSIAIPNLLSSRRASNEASAIASLRTIHTAQTAYISTSRDNNFGTMSQLYSAKLIDEVLGSGVKSNYSFPNFNIITKTNATPSYYFSTAVPTVSSGVLLTGFRSFAISEAGVVHKRSGAFAPTIDQTTRIFITGSPLN